MNEKKKKKKERLLLGVPDAGSYRSRLPDAWSYPSRGSPEFYFRLGLLLQSVVGVALPPPARRARHEGDEGPQHVHCRHPLVYVPAWRPPAWLVLLHAPSYTFFFFFFFLFLFRGGVSEGEEGGESGGVWWRKVQHARGIMCVLAPHTRRAPARIGTAPRKTGVTEQHELGKEQVMKKSAAGEQQAFYIVHAEHWNVFISRFSFLFSFLVSFFLFFFFFFFLFFPFFLFFFFLDL